jgi:ribonuclease T1
MDCSGSVAPDPLASQPRLPRGHRQRRVAAVGSRGFLGLVFAFATACVLLAGVVPSTNARTAHATLGTMRAAELPAEGRTVLAAIRAGGPLAFKRDGITFANREGVLPRETRGYYAEYTVPTPGVRTRGARRIIAGRGASGDFRSSGEYYYTDDHYESFRRILQ